MRAMLVCAMLATLAAVTAAEPAAAAVESTRQSTSIPAEPLATALKTLARQRGFQVLYRSELVKALRTRGVSGSLTVDEALAGLLQGTGLTYRFVDPRTVTIVRAEIRSSDEAPTPAADGKATANSQPPGDEAGKPLDPSGPSGSPAAEGGTASLSADSSVLQEVTVTADKIAEPLMSVPMALTALTGSDLERSSSYRFEDYVGKVPGLTMIDDGASSSQLVIRGITTGVNVINTSVASYIDETPFTEAGPGAGSGFIAPDLDTFDMERIEVLKGPQGTLYGANALGGLLKFVTNAPDVSGFAAKVESGVSSVTDGATGFDVHAMVNMPLASDAALRLVGYDTDYPGFIDDPSRGLTDINGEHVSGGRASLLYVPADSFSVRLNALYQVRSWADWPNEDVSPGTLAPIYGSLEQEHLISQPGKLTTQLYNVTMNWDAGFAKLLSSTSYYSNDNQYIQDYSDSYESLLTSVFGAPYGLAVQAKAWYVHSFTQELRLTSSGDGPLQWLAGAYFTNQNADENTAYVPIDATTDKILYSDPLGLGGYVSPTQYREHAGFGNLDYHFSSTFDVSAGARYSENDQTFHEYAPGIFGGGYDFGRTSSQSVVTYSTDARWHVAPRTMLYARVATGFAPGGPNDSVPNQVVPSTYGSSKTVDYELGVKSSELNGLLTTQLSVFDIEWSKIQLVAIISGFGTIVNGSSARSKGFEWDLGYHPLPGLTLGFNGAYTEAYLTQAAPASVNAGVGARLPGSPLWETSTDIEYERSLVGPYSGFASLEWRFSGSRYAEFQSIGPRQVMPSYNVVDLHAGVENDRWSAELYVKNLTNRIVINYIYEETLQGGLGAQSATVMQPRTIGLDLTCKF
jgi:iron complex outermembrane recepter protein